MLTVADLPPSELRARLSGDGFVLAVSPFLVRLQSSIPGVAGAIGQLYADYGFADSDSFADFHVAIAHSGGLRSYFGRAQSKFLFDGTEPFKPLPLAQAYPSFEWGLNWCIANHCHQFLVVHAAVVERDGRAAALAAPPGSGKSTLCAALVNSGWRLFSDELALIDVSTGEVVAVPRPICLKNASIDVINRFAPGVEFGPVINDTRKGTVAHLRPPKESIEKADIRARIRWIIFPKYESALDIEAISLSKAKAGWSLANNAFNFSTLGEAGFNTLSGVAGESDAYEIRYGNLDSGIRFFEALAQAS